MQANVKAPRKAPAKAKAAPAAATEAQLSEQLATVNEKLAALPPAPEAAAPTTEAPAKPSAADKRAEYAATAEAAKAIFRALDSAISVPIKPGAFKAKPLTAKAYSLTERGAAAIYIAVAASGKPFTDGGTYGRRFNIGNTPYTIENGAFSDFIGSAYTVDSTPGLGAETFTLNTGAAAAIRSKLGNKIAAFTL